MTQVQHHFVTFYIARTMIAEESRCPIDRWDTDEAIAMSAEIMERHGATPYGFRFITRGRDADELDSREIDRSPMHYLGGKVETLQEIEARNDPAEGILRENMVCNGWDRIWVSTRGWKWTQPLNSDDIVLELPSAEGTAS